MVCLVPSPIKRPENKHEVYARLSRALSIGQLGCAPYSEHVLLCFRFPCSDHPVAGWALVRHRSTPWRTPKMLMEENLLLRKRALVKTVAITGRAFARSSTPDTTARPTSKTTC